MFWTCSRWLLSGFVILVVTLAGWAQRNAKVPDPDPELERQTFQVAPGFEVTLWAADPLLAKPIQINFDAAGRMWVASSVAYPQIKPGQKPNDKILILEDTNNDGKADKTTVFLDGLLIPTGVEPGDGGAYVANSTEILHVTEKNGKADQRKVVLSGFGTEDTHHIIHTFRWGPDGLMYFNQSIYIHSHIETPHGPKRLNAGGIWAFRPETLQLDIFARGWVNSWGHNFDKWGQSFATDGAGGEGINYVVPGGYYVASIGPDASRQLHGLNPGSPKYCGQEIVSGRHLPDDWQGNVITNDFRGHRVCRFAIKDDGAGFASVQMPDVIRSTHPAFRPIDVKMGPDGAIYIADWYNPIIQHGEVDFRDPRRDLTHGRIWKVTAKNRPLVEKPKLVGQPVAALLEQLKAPEQWTRQFAKRVLKERGAAAVLPELSKWVAALDSKDRDFEHRRLEALWVYQSLNVVEPKLLDQVLASPSFEARAAAVRVALHWQDRLPNILDLLTKGVEDDHPRVRLEAVRALGSVPHALSGGIAMRAMNRPVDRWLDYSLWLAARELEPQWGGIVRTGSLPFYDIKHLIFALQAADARGIAPTLMTLIESGAVKPTQQSELLALIAGSGGPKELSFVLDRAQQSDNPLSLLQALDTAARQRQVRPAGNLGVVAQFLRSESQPIRLAAMKLAGAWKVESARKQLTAIARTDAQIESRIQAVRSMADVGGPAAVKDLLAINTSDQPLEVRRAAIVGLVGLDLNAAAKATAAVMAANPPSETVAELTTAFVQQRGGADALTSALGETKLPADVAKIAIRTSRSMGRESPALTAALTKAGSLSAKRVYTEKEFNQLLARIPKEGDPARGELVFRRKDLGCQKCHAIGGAGGLVGPDMLSLGASSPLDYIVESLLEPNKKVKENFNSLKIEMSDGKQYTGIKVRETGQQLVIRDGEDREVVLSKNKIEEMAPSGSIMPEGLLDSITERELVDLSRFLSELGKVGGSYTVGPARIVRRWLVLEPTKEAVSAMHRVGLHAPAVNSGLIWSSAYSAVGGLLPRDAMPTAVVTRQLEKTKQTISYARAQLDVGTAGPIRLTLNDITGLSLWLDGTSIPIKPTMDVPVSAGNRNLTFAIDWNLRKTGLQVELQEVPGSPARVTVVSGK